MNSFIMWCSHHRDLIISCAVFIAALAGYWTAQDIAKCKLRKLHPYWISQHTGEKYCKTCEVNYPCETLKVVGVRK